MGLFGGTQIETNKRNLVRNVIAWIGFNRIEKNSNARSRCLFGRLYDMANIHANADMAK